MEDAGSSAAWSCDSHLPRYATPAEATKLAQITQNVLFAYSL